jgi:lysyl-tRNA synthetase class 1
MQDLGSPTPERRKGNFAVVGALDFQHRRLHGAPVWEMHWQPMSTIVDATGTEHHLPDAISVDDEVITEWSGRAGRTRHPLLRAHYADLAWEIPRFRRAELTVRADVTMARTAIDGYLEAVERGLAPEDLYAWNYIERAVELAASINDLRTPAAREAGCIPVSV